MEQVDRAKCVCRLSGPEGHGTGFYYGDGWVVTTSQVVGEHASRLPNIEVQFVHPGGPGLRLQPQRRVCFLVPIEYDFHDCGRLDVVLFRLCENETRPEVGLADGGLAVPVKGRVTLPAKEFNTYGKRKREKKGKEGKEKKRRKEKRKKGGLHFSCFFFFNAGTNFLFFFLSFCHFLFRK
jgi:hypothetical protein